MPSLRRLQHALARALGDAALELWAEMPDQALDRPGGGVAQRADRMALDLLGDVEQLIDRLDLGVAGPQFLHDPPHPAGALTARGALAAALMLVEIADAADRADDVGRL